jgi:hypothetical protein
MAETATGSGQSRTTHRQRAAPKFNYIILKLQTLPYTYFWARRPSHFAKINCMSAELMMWFVLATKMAVTALFVTAATIIAERLGARSRFHFHFFERGCEPRTEQRHGDLSHGLCSDRPTTLDVAQHIPCICNVAGARFGVQPRPMGRMVGICS